MKAHASQPHIRQIETVWQIDREIIEDENHLIGNIS